MNDAVYRNRSSLKKVLAVITVIFVSAFLTGCSVLPTATVKNTWQSTKITPTKNATPSVTSFFTKAPNSTLLITTAPAFAASPAPEISPTPTDATPTNPPAAAVKNVIIMISDGWGYNQILSTDYFSAGRSGVQNYEAFPIRLAMSTYSLGQLTPADDQLGIYDPATIWSDFDRMKLYAADSATAGTAMSTGMKTYDAAIGVDPQLQNLEHIGQVFEDQGKMTGVVTSVELSHATPASFVAHNADRSNYRQIANEMIRDSATDVIIGTGNPLYDDNGIARTAANDSAYYDYVGGQETWDALTAGTLGNDANGDGKTEYWDLIQTKAEFEDLQTGPTPDRLIGVPQVFSTLRQARSGDATAGAYIVDFNRNLPNLALMSKVALNVLDNDKDGFFLMIEGGAVDWAAHANQSGRLIEEQADFNAAVAAVCEWVNENSSWNDTLLIVTGDHETGYLTGSAGVYDQVVNNGKGMMPTMAWNSIGHTNQLVPFYAKGAGADIFDERADLTDPVRGRYLDNTDISTAIRALITR